MEGTRINKYLAECGVASRREADILIAQGRITINGITAQPGSRVCETDCICVNGKKIKGKEEKVVIAYNKPNGVTCTTKDAHAKRTVIDDLQVPFKVTYAGRLDKDSEGLLLMTNDGDLNERIMKSANNHEKEYVVKTKKSITEDFLEKMRNGIFLHELDVTTRACKVEKIGEYTFDIVLTQGLNRQIRRMCFECGYDVVKLKRVRVMNILLGDLKAGEHRFIVGAELAELYRMSMSNEKYDNE